MLQLLRSSAAKHAALTPSLVLVGEGDDRGGPSREPMPSLSLSPRSLSPRSLSRGRLLRPSSTGQDGTRLAAPRFGDLTA
eukprot:CAMPEP_0174725020 /NCGR_PEP_ID=MMETSP1094-20130205/44658_1 /TAXON_ID=156173 /ORGANISM="Chrysochromulina brevifilum, Strain UTEX LB 985" /LENGTH=79 /DNA_ID=CAMNT_0015926331 /DNA_START=1 /DNA_END=241 /DNA_ORIENTATION=-